jgi:Cu2+-exporting ATPase
MEVTVRHYVPGRMRLHVPELARKAALAEAALAWLGRQPGISTARLNEACAILVIEYDRAYEPILKGILTLLRGVSLRQLATLVTASAEGKPEAGGSPQVVLSKPVPQSPAVPTKGEVPGLFSSQSPLGLPTLSLLMAFSGNPFVVAVNMPMMLWNAIPIAGSQSIIEPVSVSATDSRWERVARG